MSELFDSCRKVTSYDVLYELTDVKKDEVVAVISEGVNYPWHNIIYYKCHIVEGQQVWAGNTKGTISEYQDLEGI